jgi:integral membrane sensor domain MASE1
MADILVIAVLLRRLLGPRGALDQLRQVGGMLVAIVAGAAITATVATLSSLAGDVIASSDIPAFWRSWSLADASGSLIVIPLAIAWAHPAWRTWRRRDAWEAMAMIGAVGGLSAIALSGTLLLTYLVFPALIWAVLRFGPQGGTIAVAIAAGMAVAITASDVGPFVQHSITQALLGTQLYIAVAALTTLCLAAIVAERRPTPEPPSGSRIGAAARPPSLPRKRNREAAAQTRGRFCVTAEIRHPRGTTLAR